MKIRYSLFIGLLLLTIPTVTLAGGSQFSLAGALSSLDGEYAVPAAWSGIWTDSYIEYDCDTAAQTGSGSGTDTLCTGDPIYLSDDSSVSVVCTGTVTDTGINVECTWTSEVIEGCTASVSVIMHATRTGDSYQSTFTMTVAYIGEACGPIPEYCVRRESTGTRIAPAPPTCSTPVEDATWGGIKALYR